MLHGDGRCVCVLFFIISGETEIPFSHLFSFVPLFSARASVEIGH